MTWGDAIRALPAVQPRKEVMPDVSNDPAHAPDAAPASTDDAGGAGVVTIYEEGMS